MAINIRRNARWLLRPTLAGSYCPHLERVGKDAGQLPVTLCLLTEGLPAHDHCYAHTARFALRGNDVYTLFKRPGVKVCDDCGGAGYQKMG